LVVALAVLTIQVLLVMLLMEMVKMVALVVVVVGTTFLLVKILVRELQDKVMLADEDIIMVLLSVVAAVVVRVK
jgi:hypothetical protein